MKKLIVFEEDEFKDKFIEFCNHFMEQQHKGYGVSLVNNEDNLKLDNKESICGSLLMTWDKTFNIK
jgi:hypothetical protein